jgi:RNA polymerase sigma-70 factor (ECF subfamily)
VQSADDDLVRRLRDGDEGAFRELVRALHGALTKLALAFVGSPAAAEEVVQDTWMAVIAGLDAFEGRSSVRTWIGTILVNRAKTRGVRDKRAVPFSSIEDEACDSERFTSRGFWNTPPTAWDAVPEAIALRKEACAIIEREIHNLPTAQATIVMLRDVEGWSAEEVCASLEITEANQRVLLHRGRARLRAALERHHQGGAR